MDFAYCARLDYLDCRFYHGTEFERPDIESQLARDDPRYVEQIADELVLGLRVALDRLDRAHRLVIQLAHQQQRRPSDNRIQRRAQFVRHHRQELILEPVGLFGLRTRFFLPQQQASELPFGLLAFRYVARDLGRPDDLAVLILNR